MSYLSLHSSVFEVIRTTAKFKSELEKIQMTTLGSFLEYFPRDYEDRSTVTEFSQIRADQKNILLGTLSNIRREKTKNNFSLVKGNFTEEQSNSLIECVWFNSPGLEKRLPVHQRVMVIGKAKLGFGRISLQSPQVELYDGDSFGSIFPLYSERGILSPEWFFRKIHEEILPRIKNYDIHIPTIIPKEIVEKENLMMKRDAVLSLHSPESTDHLAWAKKTISFEELFVLQMASIKKKYKIQHLQHSLELQIDLNPEMVKDFFSTLPFTPTNAQKIALFEIYKDYETGLPMQRLLEGDVGSGKTLVAVGAMIPILQKNMQCALLAPTEILASQLYTGAEKFLIKMEEEEFWEKWGKENKGLSVKNTTLFKEKNTNKRIAYLSGSVKGKKREEILSYLRTGEIDILVGTHALLEDPVIFKELGLVVVDEQHRFGVLQRERLIEKGNPHFLQMSATPIPRTLAIVAFGDLDISVLNELPPGRKPIETKVIKPGERRTIEIFIDDQIEKGRQIFVVCPLVEESEHFDELKSATDEYIHLSEHIFSNRRIALLHGKMKPKEKDKIMNDFKDHEYDILVATSVVEVGVDVPNATIMLIEGAERFGLSQLHQFRGRVGRGSHKSYCFLSPTKSNQNSRLQAIEKTQNGFELAEIDMHIRGTGEVYGLRQSGIPDLHMASLMDGREVVHARQVAEEFFQANQKNLSAFPALEYAVEQRTKSMKVV